MSHRDRNRKSGINDSNRHKKYNKTNKWKSNHWGSRFHNYGNSNYRNEYDYGAGGHSDFRYESNWGQTQNSSIWDANWYNNQHQNFGNTNYSQNIFSVNSGNGINFSRSRKNVSDKMDRRSDSCQPAPSKQTDTVSHLQTKKKIEKNLKDTPSTVTSLSSTMLSSIVPYSSQPCNSNSVDRISDNTTVNKQQVENSAEQVTKKLIHQLTSMNKHNLKQMINNPSSKYETALQTHARNRLRAEMRTKLQNMSSNQEQQLLNNVLETEESVDMDKIPDNVFDEIGRVLDINLLGQEDNLSKKYYDNDTDKDKDQITYPEDLFLRAEKLLMENSILFLEDRLNDSILNVSNDRLDEDRTPVKIKNEIKEEIEDVPQTNDVINDENFLEIQEGNNDNYLLNDLVFEDRVGCIANVDEADSIQITKSYENEMQEKVACTENTTSVDNIKDNISSNTSKSFEISAVVTADTNTESPKKIDLFTKLQNCGAFNLTSTKRKGDIKIMEKIDYKRDPYYRKKKKKHKSRSRSTSRLRSRSRSKSRSRNSHIKDRSKKSLSLERSHRTNAITENSLELPNLIKNIETQSQSNVLSVIVPCNEAQVIAVDNKTKSADILEQQKENNHKNFVTDSPLINEEAEDEVQKTTNATKLITESEEIKNDDIENSSVSVVANFNIQKYRSDASTVDYAQIATELEPISMQVSNKMNEIVTTLVQNSDILDTAKETCQTVTVEDESCASIGSNLVETNSSTLTSESQSSIADDSADLVSLNYSSIRKNGRKSKSRHKCDKEKHSSSHKNKKSTTYLTAIKNPDQKDNSSTNTANTSIKHQSPLNENSTQRVWRSAGEKKCIEPTSKSSFRSVDLFETPRKVDSKSSSQRKESCKTQTNRQNKLPSNVPTTKIEIHKSSLAKKQNTITTVKVKATTQHQHVADINDLSLSNEAKVNNQHHSAPLLSDSIKIASDNTSVLQRMKEIDLKLMELQVKKTFIDEQIHNLHREKNVIDQTTIQLQNERFLLLSSLLTNNATNVTNVANATTAFNDSCEKKVCEAHSSLLERNFDANTLTISSDEDSKVKKSVSKGQHSSTESPKKRKIFEDVSNESFEVGKCKKVKINLNQMKSAYKSKLNFDDLIQPQSDLKPVELKLTTRRCSIRLTRFSSKKVKLMTGREMNADEESDVTFQQKTQEDYTHSQRPGLTQTFDGSFFGHRLPIVHLQIIQGCLVAASEDSNIYKHDMLSGKLLGTFTEHSKTVSNFIATDNNSLYSVSLDGFLKKFNLKNFEKQLLSIYIGEALQVMEYSWDTAFIGSRSGKIYLFDTKADSLAEECLCSVGKSIMALKASKEGPRKILIASSRCHNINVRDAISGLLLRTIEVPDKLTIYSIHLDGGQLYCGTNKNLVFRYEFTSGTEISRIKLGTGTICLKSYKNSIILGGCYDGYIYSYDTKNEIQLSRFPGSGKMLLHFDVYGDKIIAASKDKSLRVLDIPDDIVLHE